MNATEESLRDAYRTLALRWSAADHSARKANRIFDKHHALYKTMRETPEGRRAILSLLDDPERVVRLLAGTHALRIDPDRAQRILEEVEVGGGLLSVDATYTLIAFREGTLNLDW